MSFRLLVAHTLGGEGESEGENKTIILESGNNESKIMFNP
ncbi:hypothetical protein OSCI_1880011 [Kamptonema sp. PCC 6506]|nr:hypothetical protein OSCI_1880011 [Kamptonema sp. PCC 6506]